MQTANSRTRSKFPTYLGHTRPHAYRLCFCINRNGSLGAWIMQMFFKMVGRLQGGDGVLLRAVPSCCHWLSHWVNNILCQSFSFKFIVTCILLLGVIKVFFCLFLNHILQCLLRDLQYLLDLKTELWGSMSDSRYHDVNHYNTNINCQLWLILLERSIHDL